MQFCCGAPIGLKGQGLGRGSIYIPIVKLGSQSHTGDDLLGPDSIMVGYMDPLGFAVLVGSLEGFG